VILGKTHVPELEALAVTESLSFGATRNPWDLTRTPGGSSGGSGAAVAAGLAAAAQGTDGVGSIRIPAGCCGLFGLKPQRGRLPLQNGFGGLAVAGALTRDVLDSALFLDAVAGTDLAAAARRAPGACGSPTRSSCRAASWGGSTTSRARRSSAPWSTCVRWGTRRAARSRLRKRRLSVVARYLHAVRSEADAMAHPERLSRRTRGIAALGPRHSRAARAAALGQEAADRERVGVLLREFDVLLSPLLTRRPPPVGEWEGLPAPVALSGMAHFTAFLGFWNHTGQPAAAVPVEQAADGFPGRGPADRPARRRGDAALAVRPTRVGHELAFAAAAAGDMSQGSLLELAVEVAHEAGAGLRAAFSRIAEGELAISAKSTPHGSGLRSRRDDGDPDPATPRGARPDDAIMGEEGDDRRGRAVCAGSWIRSTDGQLPLRDPRLVRQHRVRGRATGAARGRLRPMRDETWTATRDGRGAPGRRTDPGPDRASWPPTLVATGSAMTPACGSPGAHRRAAAAARARYAPPGRGRARSHLDGRRAIRRLLRARRQHWDVAAGALICTRAGLAVHVLAPAPPADRGLLVAARRSPASCSRSSRTDRRRAG
jgi:hypothetical protein